MKEKLKKTILNTKKKLRKIFQNVETKQILNLLDTLYAQVEKHDFEGLFLVTNKKNYTTLILSVKPDMRVYDAANRILYEDFLSKYPNMIDESLHDLNKVVDNKTMKKEKEKRNYIG